MRSVFIFGLVVAVAAIVVVKADDDSDESTGLCEGYEQDVFTKPDNKRKVFSRRNPLFEITSVHNTKRDPNTVYWCDLKIPDINDVIKHWKHYDFNATHWWVEKGCSGTFLVEECDTSAVIDGGPKPTSGKSPMQGTQTGPKAGKDWKHIMSEKQFDMNTWDKEGTNMV